MVRTRRAVKRVALTPITAAQVSHCMAAAAAVNRETVVNPELWLVISS